jgi:hypothetical protein
MTRQHVFDLNTHLPMLDNILNVVNLFLWPACTNGNAIGIVFVLICSGECSLHKSFLIEFNYRHHIPTILPIHYIVYSLIDDRAGHNRHPCHPFLGFYPHPPPHHDRKIEPLPSSSSWMALCKYC